MFLMNLDALDDEITSEEEFLRTYEPLPYTDYSLFKENYGVKTICVTSLFEMKNNRFFFER